MNAKQLIQGALAGIVMVFAVLGMFRTIDLINGRAEPCKLPFSNGQIVTDKLTGKPLIISSASCGWTLVRDANNNRFFIGSAELVK